MNTELNRDLARLRAIALALPRGVEKVSHGMPVFFIEKGRSFAWFSDNHHGSGVRAVLVKTGGLDEQAMLIEADHDLFYRPPYLGVAGWIGMRIDTSEPDWTYIAARVRASWQQVAPARLRETLAHED